MYAVTKSIAHKIALAKFLANDQESFEKNAIMKFAVVKLALCENSLWWLSSARVKYKLA